VALATIRAHAAIRGPLLPVLHALQERFGFVDPRAVRLIAGELNLSRADVQGGADLGPAHAPADTLRVQVCRGEACASVGGAALADHARASLALAFAVTAADGWLTLEQVFCLSRAGRASSGSHDQLVAANVAHRPGAQAVASAAAHLRAC
jgi:formate dehydrogenase subunit gamma